MSTMQISRRLIVKGLGAGLLISVTAPDLVAQEQPRRRGGGGGGGGGFRGSPSVAPSARLHIGKDGLITVMTAKVECGQGARAEITQAAAEELRVPPERITLIMADTALCPSGDGTTAGSGTTPRCVPSVRSGCAAAREILIGLAAAEWSVDRATLTLKDGNIVEPKGNRSISYGDLAAKADADKNFSQPPANVTVTAVADWKVMGQPLARPNGRDLVTGKHAYPSDIKRPGMLYGAVIRPASHGAKLNKLADAPAGSAQVIHEGEFAGVVAPTRWEAQNVAADLSKNSKWDGGGFPCSSETLYDYLTKGAKTDGDSAGEGKHVKATYHVAYIQHAPLEPRATVAEWSDDKANLTVWTGTQNPFGVRSELSNAFGLKPEAVHVIVPDFGGGFGGKHSGECAVEAARLAKAAGKPVSLRWTREEEMTWAYYRPAGVIQASAVLSGDGRITSWSFLNINSGQNAVEPPYKVGTNRSRSTQGSKPPLRHGSYRALASTANVFGRESFIDECAAAANNDPLEFRLSHLEDPRLRAVLEAAAKKFDWRGRVANKEANTGVGVACGTEKNSFVACCAKVRVDPAAGAIHVIEVVQAHECGKVINPTNLKNQNAGAIMMGIGAALREEVRFQENGEVVTTNFDTYRVPRMADLPNIEIHLLDRPDLPSVGAGETPIIAIAPAIANAVFNATGQRLRSMPLKLAKA